MRLAVKHQCAVLHAFPTFLVLLTASKYSWANRFHPSEIGDVECVNTNSSRYDAVKSSTKCTTMWSDRNCKGSELESGRESFLSISGCNRCVRHMNSGYQCASQEKCIPLTWICDTGVDCTGGDDERNCEFWNVAKCIIDQYGDSGYFCNGTNGEQCIPLGSMCETESYDADIDDDWISETSTNPDFTIESGQIEDFECVNINTRRFESIIKSSTNCRRFWTKMNCHPGSDLSKGPTMSVSGCRRCTQRSGSGGFHCKMRGVDSCIPLSFVCDGEGDCDGGDDEENCDGFRKTCRHKGNTFWHTCQGSKFPRCIPREYLCNGVNECLTGDDEVNCTNSGAHLPIEEPEVALLTSTIMAPDEGTTSPSFGERSNECGDGTGFKCRTDSGLETCIPLNWLCDTDADCAGGIDEKYCDRKCNFKGNANGFKCQGPEGSCISRTWICDGVGDCPFEEDELGCADVEQSTSTTTEMWMEDQESNTIYSGPVPETIEQLDMSRLEAYNQNDTSLKCIAYKRSDPSASLMAESVEFGGGEKIVIYLPGYATADLQDGLRVKEALFLGTEDVDWVILVDWRKLSLPFDDNSVSWLRRYAVVATRNVETVAEFVTGFLVGKLKHGNDVYFVGFGLGAQIAGTAARLAAASDNFFVDRITALDPAGPIFEYSLFGVFTVDTKNTLRSTDAAFVDVIHASSVLGMNNAAGDLDIFLTENDCWRPSCRHQKALELYISSLTRCSLVTCPRSGECTPDTVSDFGYLADKYAGRGKHDLIVVTNFYSWSDNLCSNFKAVYLPAKDRICGGPPRQATNATDCENKPYLSECSIYCREQNVYRKSVCSWHPKVALDSEEEYNHPVSEAGTGPMEWQGSADHCRFPIGCFNVEGHNVPSFVSYKPPNSSQHAVFNPDGSRLISPFNNSMSNIVRALESILERKHDDPVSYVVWQDDARNMEEASEELLSHSHGRSNGVLAFDKNGGFLMIKSFPGFPLGPEYPMTKSQGEYAQLAVCVSMYSPSKHEFVAKLNTILDGLETFNPKVVTIGLGHDLDPSVKTKLANLGKTQSLATPSKPKVTDIPLTSEFNAHFYGMYKLGGRPHDAFASLSRKYATNLKVQSGKDEAISDHWPSSPCWSPFTVENVKSMRFEFDVNGWNTAQDHSNWAVAKGMDGDDENSSPLVCFGDLNRVSSSMARGGMFLCTREKSFYDGFSRIPDQLETCT